MKRPLLILLFFLSFCFSFSQADKNTGLVLFGEVTDYLSCSKTDSVKIEVYFEHIGWKTICYTDKKGKWDSLYLDYDKSYTLRLSHKNYFSKNFEIVLTDFSDSLKNVICRINADAKLIPKKSNLCNKTGLDQATVATLRFREWTGLPDWYENKHYEYLVKNYEICLENVKAYEKQYSVENKELTIKGEVSDYITGSSLKCPEIKLYKNDTLLKTLTPDYYKFTIKKVDYGHKYKLEISHAGYYSRHVFIDLTGIHDSVPKTKDVEVNMRLMQTFPDYGCDISFLKLPVSTLKYSKTVEDLNWNFKQVEIYIKEMEKYLKCAEYERIKEAEKIRKEFEEEKSKNEKK